jgi:chaperonin GroEL (HSP60 family)
MREIRKPVLVSFRLLEFQVYSMINNSCSLDMNEGSIGSMKKLGITESYKLKRQVVLSASEAAEMIIR